MNHRILATIQDFCKQFRLKGFPPYPKNIAECKLLMRKYLWNRFKRRNAPQDNSLLQSVGKAFKINVKPFPKTAQNISVSNKDYSCLGHVLNAEF